MAICADCGGYSYLTTEVDGKEYCNTCTPKAQQRYLQSLRDSQARQATKVPEHVLKSRHKGKRKWKSKNRQWLPFLD